MINANDALRIRLVQKVVEPDELMDTVIKIAKNIASKGPEAIKKVKSVVRLSREMSRNYGEELEAEEFGSLFGEGRQGKEGMQAFLEKRSPEW